MTALIVATRAPACLAVRVADMARRSHMPIVGVVENMTGDVFGEGGGAELASELGVPLVASIPLDTRVVAGGDNGIPVVTTDSPAGQALSNAADSVVGLVPPADLETCTGRIAKLLANLDTGAA